MAHVEHAGRLPMESLHADLQELFVAGRISPLEHKKLTGRFRNEERLRNPMATPPSTKPGIAAVTDLTDKLCELGAIRLRDRYHINLGAAAAYAEHAKLVVANGEMPAQDSHYFPQTLLGTSSLPREEVIAMVAERIHLYERYHAFQCLHFLLKNVVEANEAVLTPAQLVMMQQTFTLLRHSREATPGRIEFCHSAITYLLIAIQQLSAEALKLSGEARSGADRAVDDAVGSLEWRYACAVAHRSTAARCIYLAATCSQLSMHDTGNAVYLHIDVEGSDAESAGKPFIRSFGESDMPYTPYTSCGVPTHFLPEGICPPIWGPAARDAQTRVWTESGHAGGEIGRLVETVRFVSDEMWSSCLGEGSPAWEVTVWLLMALAQVGDYFTPRIDPDTGRKAVFIRYVAGQLVNERTSGNFLSASDCAAFAATNPDYKCKLWPLLQTLCIMGDSVSHEVGADSKRAVLLDVSGHQGQVSPIVPDGAVVYWAHARVQGVVQLIFAQILHSLFRFQPGVDVLKSDHGGLRSMDPACLPYVSDDPLIHGLLPEIGGLVKDFIRTLVMCATCPQRRAISFLSRIVASPAFVHSSLSVLDGCAGPVELLHVLVTELVRLDRTIVAKDRSGSHRPYSMLRSKFATMQLHLSRRHEKADRWVAAARFEDLYGQLQLLRSTDYGDRQAWRIARLMAVTSTGIVPHMKDAVTGTVLVDVKNLLPATQEPTPPRFDVWSSPGKRLMLNSFPIIAEQVTDKEYALVVRPAAPRANELPDCLEDVLALQAQLARGLPRLACRYWCLRGDAHRPYMGLPVGNEQNPAVGGDDNDQSFDVEVLRADGDLSLFDEGVGVGVSMVDRTGAVAAMDPLSYLVRICHALSLDARAAMSVGRGMVAAPQSNVQTARWAGGVQAAALAVQHHGADFKVHPDALVLESRSHSHNPDLLLQLDIVRDFASTVMDLFGALGGNVRCADGRTCVEHLASFLAGIKLEGTTLRTGPSLYASSLAKERQQCEPHKAVPLMLQVMPMKDALPAGLLHDICLAVVELDPEQQALRQAQYESRCREWQEGQSYRLDNPLGEFLPFMGATDDAPQEEPRRPELRQPHVGTLLARLRLLSTLCEDPVIRDRIAAAEISDPSLVDASVLVPTRTSGGTSFTPYVALGSEGQPVVNAVPCNRSTSIIILLLRMLGLAVHLPVKAAVFIALSRLATASPVHACIIRDGLESKQVLATLPAAIGSGPASAGPRGLAAEHASGGTEEADRFYGSSMAFMDLMRIVHAQVPTVGLGIAARQPGLHPHLQFALDMLSGHRDRPTAAERNADTWKLAFSSLGFLLDILRAYRVHYPPSAEAEADAAAASKSLPALPSDTALVDAPAPIPSSARRTADTEGSFLYAYHVDASFSLAQVKDMLAAAPDRRVRLASIAEVNHFAALNGAGGGRFRGWTSDEVLCWYDASKLPKAQPVPGTSAHCFWVLRTGTAGHGEVNLPRGGGKVAMSALVEVPAFVVGTTGVAAKGFVPGEPRFDFVLSALPQLHVARGSTRLTLPSPRSVGFELLRALLQDKDALMAIILIIAQAGCDGLGEARGAASLEEAADSLKDPGSPADTAALAAGLRAIRGRPRESGDQLEAKKADPGAGSGVAADKASSQAEGQLDVLASRAVHEGMSGLPCRADSTVMWREKAVAAALAVLDAALVHDKAFVEGAHAIRLPGMQSHDLLYPLPELLRKKSILPYIVRAAGYSRDTRVGYIAGRVVHRLVASRSRELSPAAFGAALLQCKTAFDAQGRAAALHVSSSVAICLQDDPGSSEQYDEEDAAAANERREEDNAALLRRIDKAGLIDIGMLNGRDEEETQVVGLRDLSETLVVVPSHGSVLEPVNMEGPGAGLTANLATRLASVPATRLIPTELLDIRLGGIIVPLGVMDGPQGIRVRTGWADRPVRACDVRNRADLSAHEARRLLLLLALLRSVEEGKGNTASAELGLAHVLLGYRSTPAGGLHLSAHAAESCTWSIVDSLARPDFFARRPHAAKLSSRLLAALLTEPRTAPGARAFLVTHERHFTGAVGGGTPILASILAQLPGVDVTQGPGPSIGLGAAGELVQPHVSRAARFNHAYGALADCVAAELHAYATSAPVNVDRLQAIARVLMSPGARPGLGPMLTTMWLPLHLGLTHPGAPPDMLHDAVALLPAVMGLQALDTALAQIASGAGYLRARAIPTPELGPVVSLVEADSTATVRSVATQLYNPAILRMLLAALQRGDSSQASDHALRLNATRGVSSTSSWAAGTSTSRMDLSVAGMSSESAGSGPGPARVAERLERESRARTADEVMAWAERHNEYVITLRGTHAGVAGLSRLTTAFIMHAMPDPDPAVAAAPAPAASQARRQGYLGERLGEVLEAAVEAAQMREAGGLRGNGEDEHALTCAPSLLLNPLLESASAILHKLAATCPTLRLPEGQMGRLTMLAVRLILARNPGAPGSRITKIDSAASDDPAPAYKCRALSHLLLLDMLRYACGVHPGVDIRAHACGNGSGSPFSVLAANAPTSPSEIETSMRGVLSCLEVAGPDLIEAVVRDVYAGPALFRASSSALLTALLQTSVPGEERTLLGMMHTPAPSEVEASYMPGLRVRLYECRVRMVSRLAAGGLLLRLVQAAGDVDGALASAEAARTVGSPSKRPRTEDWPSASARPVLHGALASAYANTFQAILTIAQLDDGSGSCMGAHALHAAGLHAMLSRLSWPGVLADRLVGSLSRSLGLHGSRVDEMVAEAVGDGACLLQPALAILVATCRAFPQDRAVAAFAFAWLRRRHRLVELLVQAALCGAVPMACISLASALTDVLAQAASLPGVLEAGSMETGDALAALPGLQGVDALPSSALDAMRADELVLSLLQRYALQPRAAPDAQRQASNDGQPGRTGLAALLDSHLAAAGQGAGRGQGGAQPWVSCLVPRTEEEKCQDTASLRDASLHPSTFACIGESTAVTTFRVAGVLAGERLMASVASYLTLRAYETLTLVTLDGSSASLASTSTAAAPVAVSLFWPTSRATPDVLRRSSARPSIRVLADAVEQAALALVHASLQAAQAVRMQDAGRHEGGGALPPVHSAHTTVQCAISSRDTLARTIEQLATLWLAQVAGDPQLRVDSSSAEDLRRLRGSPSVRTGLDAVDSIDSSHFLATVLQRLQRLYEEAEATGTGIGRRTFLA